MSKQFEELQSLLNRLRLTETSRALSQLIEESNSKELTPLGFLHHLLCYETMKRDEKAFERRLKQAQFPYYRGLEEFNIKAQPALSPKAFNKLQELSWIDSSYNLVLLGPTGTGKTFLSVGLGLQAIHEGYHVAFVTMGQMIHLLKTQEISRSSESRMKRLKKLDLLILDDLMFMALDRAEANLFFHFINEIYESTSIILTSNKSPNDWGELIGDEIITAAILDRIVQKSEIIQLSGESYRLTHREGIFQ